MTSLFFIFIIISAMKLAQTLYILSMHIYIYIYTYTYTYLHIYIYAEPSDLQFIGNLELFWTKKISGFYTKYNKSNLILTGWLKT